MVSAIITTYKRPPEIVQRAAQSVLNQTYKNLELIIVDDSPSDYALRDEVKKMTETLGGNVRYIQHEKNMGACVARNTGLSVATGKYVAFLDDDDEWLPEKSEKQVAIMEKDSEIALVYCGRYSYYTKTNKEILQKTEFHRGMVFEKLILENFIGSTSFPLIRKSCVDSVGWFDAAMKASQDYEVWLRIAKEYKVDYVKTPLVRYYYHDGEQITKNHAYKVDAYEKLIKKHFDYLKKDKKAHSRCLLYISLYSAELDRRKAQKAFFKALCLNPTFSELLLKTFKWLYIMPVIEKIKKKA